MITCPDGRNFIGSFPGTARRSLATSATSTGGWKPSVAVMKIFGGAPVENQEVVQLLPLLESVVAEMLLLWLESLIVLMPLFPSLEFLLAEKLVSLALLSSVQTYPYMHSSMLSLVV